MNKKQFEEETYEHKGYRYWKKSGDSVHRSRAYKEIYLKDRKKYPLSFQEYQVHHKDGDKKNNRTENLELIPIREQKI
ncbi:MAG: HNH endonuclease [Nanoarchaeota archaeon]|nr:HNH endonuclease [Nanoarchaeota archaeon]